MPTATQTPASPTKLRTGAWGAKVQSADIKAGDMVTITTRAGKSWDAKVTKVVWAGNGVSICTTESTDRPARSSSHNNSPRSSGRGTWTGCSCGSRTDSYGDLIPSPRNCRSCNHDA